MKSGQVMRNLWGIIAVALLLGGRTATLGAQDISITFHRLSQEKGLPGSENYFIFQDTFGFVWIGTEEGLYRFDGLHLQPVPLPEAGAAAPRAVEQVTSRCFEDAHKNLWFSTASAIMCYRRATGQVEQVDTGLWGLSEVAAFYLDTKGFLWLRAGSGDQSALYVFDTHSRTSQSCGRLQGSRFAVLTDELGHEQVVATALPDQYGLARTDLTDHNIRRTDVFEFTRRQDGKYRRLSSPTKNAWVDGDSVVWVGIYNGLGKFYPKKDSTVAVVNLNTQDFGYAYDVVPYGNNRLLVATADGLVVFDPLQNLFEPFQYQPKVPGSLPNGEITDLYLDPSGDLWVSGPGLGIAFAHLRKNKFPCLPAMAGIPVSALFEDRKGRIWCSSPDSGVYVFAGSVQKSVAHLNYHVDYQYSNLGVPHISEHSLFAYQGQALYHPKRLTNHLQPDQAFTLPEISVFWEDALFGIWGFSDNQALHWNEGGRTFEFWGENFFGVPKTTADVFQAHCLLTNGTRLIARGKDIFQLQTARKKISRLPWANLDFLGLQQVTAIFKSTKGDLYLADNHHRILILSLDPEGKPTGKTGEVPDTGHCTSFTETPDGGIWAACSKGLIRLEPASKRGLLTEVSDGVPNEQYHTVLPDSSGCLWLTGRNGLIRYDPVGKKFHRFESPDGLLSVTFRPNAALRGSTGEFWVGGTNGLNVFRPEAIRLLDHQPKVQLTDLQVNNAPFDPGRDLCILEYKEFDHTQNTLSFEFIALDFSAPGHNQYAYRMEGFDRDTIFNGNLTSARYTNIPPGHYTFKVWASNSDGSRWSEPRQLRLYIRPPFWERWWFYLLCALTVAALIYAWFQYRLRQALKMERMRVQISSDLHDEVGVLLSGLAMQSELLERTAQEKDKNKLHRISAVSRDAMARMRDTVWAIDARRDKLEDLLDRLREQAEETLGPKGMRYEIQVEQLRLQRNLSTAVRQNLFLIYKETLTNITKHSNGDTVQISLKKWGKGLELRVCDNGTAREKAYKATGLGLSNMQMRAEKIGGVLEITREGGFCVIVRLRAFA